MDDGLLVPFCGNPSRHLPGALRKGKQNREHQAYRFSGVGCVRRLLRLFEVGKESDLMLTWKFVTLAVAIMGILAGLVGIGKIPWDAAGPFFSALVGASLAYAAGKKNGTP